jgi:hypothetical protein
MGIRNARIGEKSRRSPVLQRYPSGPMLIDNAEVTSMIQSRPSQKAEVVEPRRRGPGHSLDVDHQSCRTEASKFQEFKR